MSLHQNENYVSHRTKYFCERKLYPFQRTCDIVYVSSFIGALSFRSELAFNGKDTETKLEPSPGVYI